MLYCRFHEVHCDFKPRCSAAAVGRRSAALAQKIGAAALSSLQVSNHRLPHAWLPAPYHWQWIQAAEHTNLEHRSVSSVPGHCEDIEVEERDEQKTFSV